MNNVPIIILILILIVIFFYLFKSKICASGYELHQNKYCVKLCDDNTTRFKDLYNNNTINCIFNESINSMYTINDGCINPDENTLVGFLFDKNNTSQDFNVPTHYDLINMINDYVLTNNINIVLNSIHSITFFGCDSISIKNAKIQDENYNIIPISESLYTNNNICEFNLSQFKNNLEYIFNNGIFSFIGDITLNKIYPIKIKIVYNDNNTYYIKIDIYNCKLVINFI